MAATTQNLTIYKGEALTLTIRVASAADLAVKAATSANPVAITTHGEHGLTTGDRVFVEGILGVTSADGNRVVAVVDTDNFTLDGIDGSGDPAYAGGGTITPLRDLSADTAEWNMVTHPLSTATALISKTSAAGEIALSNGELAITLVAADTSGLDPRLFYHEARITDASSLPTTVATGHVDLKSTAI